MKVLITGAAGFVGSTVLKQLRVLNSRFQFYAIDNLSRKGSEINFSILSKEGFKIDRCDIRLPSDLEGLPSADWVIDCAANPSVLAGIDGQSSSRQLIEHNLIGTINLLEYCKRHKAGLILLSTSRVYSASSLASLPVELNGNAFSFNSTNIEGISPNGISEQFSIEAPISLYGASKLTSESLILEYSHAFDFPVWINRCGVLAGAGQFGKAEQGIFSYWIHSFKEKKSLSYLGFEGQGYQVRDAFHPRDLAPLLSRQMLEPNWDAPKVVNLGGGIRNSISLKQLSDWCTDKFGANEVLSSKENRPLDAPWIVMDSSVAENAWNWCVSVELEQILDEISSHAIKNPNWLSEVT